MSLTGMLSITGSFTPDLSKCRSLSKDKMYTKLCLKVLLKVFARILLKV